MIDEQVVKQIPVDNLQANPLQPRGVIIPEQLQDLMDSIKKHGVLEPLVVAHTPAGHQIIAGERRWRASKLAGLQTVPAIIKKTTPRGMLEMAIVENVQRVDLNPIDRAKAFERLMIEFNLGNNEIADRVSKSASYVSNSLRLLKLPDALKDGLLSGVITEGHARALSAIDHQKSMIEAYKIILRESGSVRMAEELARRFKNQNGQVQKSGSPKKTLIISKELDKMKSDLTKSLGKKAKVILKQSRIETKIQITLKGGPEKVNERLKEIHQKLTH
ncbi:ParB/RepB/Spo0J family partition protein [Patescibacteria group bacterium]